MGGFNRYSGGRRHIKKTNIIMAIIKKVPLDEIIDVFMDLYNKGVDFIDLIASENDNRISVIFSEDYLNEEAKDNFESIEIDEDEEETTFTDEDINQLI
jgi:hypothetical protein